MTSETDSLFPSPRARWNFSRIFSCGKTCFADFARLAQLKTGSRSTHCSCGVWTVLCVTATDERNTMNRRRWHNQDDILKLKLNIYGTFSCKKCWFSKQRFKIRVEDTLATQCHIKLQQYTLWVVWRTGNVGWRHQQRGGRQAENEIGSPFLPSFLPHIPMHSVTLSASLLLSVTGATTTTPTQHAALSLPPLKSAEYTHACQLK